MDSTLSPGFHIAVEPRGLSLLQAALYLGIGPTVFVALVRLGQMPQPKLIGPYRVWDRRALDEAFETLPEEVLPSEKQKRAPADAGAEKRKPAPFHFPPPTKEQIAAVRLDMDMKRYGQSTEGMTDAQVDELERQYYERWKKKVKSSPLNKREKIALPILYREMHRVLLHGEIKGISWSTQERLEARGYVTLRRHNDLPVSWQITAAGIEAFERGETD